MTVLSWGSAYVMSPLLFAAFLQMWNRWLSTGWPETSTLSMTWTTGCLSATRMARRVWPFWTKSCTTLKASPWTRLWGLFFPPLFLTQQYPQYRFSNTKNHVLWSDALLTRQSQIKALPPDGNICMFAVSFSWYWQSSLFLRITSPFVFQL